MVSFTLWFSLCLKFIHLYNFCKSTLLNLTSIWKRTNLGVWKPSSQWGIWAGILCNKEVWGKASFWMLPQSSWFLSRISPKAATDLRVQQLPEFYWNIILCVLATHVCLNVCFGIGACTCTCDVEIAIAFFTDRQRYSTTVICDVWALASCLLTLITMSLCRPAWCWLYGMCR